MPLVAAPDHTRPLRGCRRPAARPAARATVAAAAVALALLLAPGCDAGLKPEAASTYCPAGLCGTVHFRGAVPDSTDWVRVVIYPAVPESASQLTAFAGFSDVLPLGVDSTFYTCCLLGLKPGAYGWVIVVWKKLSDSALSVSTAPSLLREVGAYLNPADTTQFGIAVVPSGGGVSGIDIVADYGKMRSITDFFPPPPPAPPSPARPARARGRR
jgi:hypothetical protein